MGRLRGKVAIITGGSQGIGRAVAQLFLAEAAQVVITGRSAELLKRTMADLAAADHEGAIAHVQGDSGTREAAKAAIDLALSRFGRVDILVNNAQSSSPGVPLEELDDDIIEITLRSGFLGTLYHMQAAFAAMRNNGDGSIINLGSRDGIYGGGMGIYAVGKEAIRGLSRVAAREWGKHNIRVNVDGGKSCCDPRQRPDILGNHPQTCGR